MASFDQLQKRRAESERGAILVLTALVILLLLFIAAFSTDLGAWYRQTEEQQRAADVGALNGISAYNRGAVAYLESIGETSILNVTDLDDAVQAERDGFVEAVLAIQALLETSGLEFTGSATFDLANDPRNFTQVSTATLVATDGSVVTITRSWVRTGGTDADPTYTQAIDVQITREGEQYFSNILRDAPEISRGAQSLLANCGAVCNDVITINPPFLPFEGEGDGDGYSPLLVDSDGDGRLDEAWAVNHHRDFGGRSGGLGNIICVDMAEQTPCDHGAEYPLPYETSNRPVEYVSPDGKIYYPARNNQINNNPSAPSGLACFDTKTQSPCGVPFLALWADTPAVAHPARLVINGPWEYEGRLYLFSQDGQGVCVELDMTTCGSIGFALQNLPLFGSGDLPAIANDVNRYVMDGRMIGDRLILTTTLGADRRFGTDEGVAFQCVNLGNDQGIIAGCGSSVNPSLNVNDSDNITFTRYNTSGNPIGVCYWEARSGDQQCVDANAQPDGTVSGLSTQLELVGAGNWSGEAIAWEVDEKVKRSFFAGGVGNYVGCWNWETGSACTDAPDGGGRYLLVDGAKIGNGVGAWTYDFAQVTDRCIIGLGHQSQFFSFDPEGMGPCTDVQNTEPISPCTCSDGTNRWGIVTLPESLIEDVTFLEATIFVNNGGTVGAHILGPVDLLATNGVLDLTSLNTSGNPDSVMLRLDADSALDGDVPRFTEDFDVPIEITVAPTLSE